MKSLHLTIRRLVQALGSWKCPDCGCLNADGHISCGFC